MSGYYYSYEDEDVDDVTFANIQYVSHWLEHRCLPPPSPLSSRLRILLQPRKPDDIILPQFRKNTIKDRLHLSDNDMLQLSSVLDYIIGNNETLLTTNLTSGRDTEGTRRDFCDDINRAIKTLEYMPPLQLLEDPITNGYLLYKFAIQKKGEIVAKKKRYPDLEIKLPEFLYHQEAPEDGRLFQTPVPPLEHSWLFQTPVPPPERYISPVTTAEEKVCDPVELSVLIRSAIQSSVILLTVAILAIQWGYLTEEISNETY